MNDKGSVSKIYRHKIKTFLRQKVVLVLLGVFLTLLFLEIGLRIGGLVLLHFQEQRNRLVLKQKGTYRIMCLGESTTVSQYPLFLEEILNQRNIGILFTVINKGVVGTNTSAILERLKYNLDTYQPNMVITMMGVNDAGKHIPYASMDRSNNIPSFSSLKVYKLTCFLWAHVSNKIQEVKMRNNNIHNSSFLAVHSSSDMSIVSQKGMGIEHLNEEDTLKQAIMENPSDDQTYGRLAHYYMIHNREIEAEGLFKKALELNPNTSWYYSSLGYIYSGQDSKRNLAEEMLKKAVELDPKNKVAYFDLGLYVYRKQDKLLQSEQAFLNAIQVDPQYYWAYIELADCYQRQNKFVQAVELLKKAIEKDPDNADQYYGALSSLSTARAEEKDIKKMYYNKADNLRLQTYNPVTSNNYLRLKKILDERKVKFVCVQYPVRSIEPLKRIFQGQTGIIFVDNETIFKESMARSSYDEYFSDKIGGDFGHCTTIGYRLLAEDIANVILKEVFDK